MRTPASGPSSSFFLQLRLPTPVVELHDLHGSRLPQNHPVAGYRDGGEPHHPLRRAQLLRPAFQPVGHADAPRAVACFHSLDPREHHHAAVVKRLGDAGAPPPDHRYGDEHGTCRPRSDDVGDHIERLLRAPAQVRWQAREPRGSR